MSPLACSSGEVACAAECPSGTQRVANQREYRDAYFQVTEASCSTVCEAISPCLAPNIPTVIKVGNDAEFECAPLPGFSSLPPHPERDTSWGELVNLFPKRPALSLPLTFEASGMLAGSVDVTPDDEKLMIWQLATGQFYWADVDPESVGTQFVTDGPFDLPLDPDGLASVNPKALADLDGDGVSDLIGSGNVFDEATQTYLGGAYVFRGLGNGSFGPVEPLTIFTSTVTVTATQVRAADFDGDGELDLLFRLSEGAPRWWRNDGLSLAGNFPTGVAQVDIERNIVVGDLDGDGSDDLYVSESASQLSQIVLGSVAGPAAALTPQGLVGGYPAMIDVEGDGRAELVLRTSDSTICPADTPDYCLAVFAITASGSATLTSTSPATCGLSGGESIAVGDGIGFINGAGCVGIPFDGNIHMVNRGSEGADLPAVVFETPVGPAAASLYQFASPTTLEVFFP